MEIIIASKPSHEVIWSFHAQFWSAETEIYPSDMSTGALFRKTICKYITPIIIDLFTD